VVEVPHVVDGDGIHAVPMGALPPQAAALNRSYLNVAGLAIEAMRTGSKELVRQAVLVDPNAASTLTPEQIWALCDELTAAHGDLIPEPLR
jgi:alpha-galactosidase